MSRIYSHASLMRLETCHPDLQRVFMEVLKVMDHSILEGHRGEEDQTKAFEAGKSKLPWPQGKHNKKPSLAVDATPFPVDFKDIPRHCFFAGIVKGVAHVMGVTIRCGVDFDMDGRPAEQNTFVDAVHFEIIE